MQNKLTAIAIKKSGDGKLFDGGGLMLVKKGEAGKWVYRYSHIGRRREMGLGSWPLVTLAEARKSRDAWAAELAHGRDPIAQRDAHKAAELAERDKTDPTFAEAVTLVFKARQATLRGGGSLGRWRSPLDTHVIPKLGRRRLSSIHQRDIRDTLAPIWHKKHPTAKKAISRIRIVFEEMQLTGFDCDPFTVDAAKRMLGAVKHTAQSIAATAWEDMPGLYAKLNTVSAVDQCLRWMILTLVRLDGCAGARFQEIDEDIWTVSAERVKGSAMNAKDFRVPLPQPCLDIAAQQAEISDDLLFPSHTKRPITSRALEMRLDKLGEAGRPHGFRSSFRTWVQDTDACGFDVAETVLGHAIGNRIERTYARSDLLDRRRHVMHAWAAYVTGATSAEVMQMAN